MFQLTQNSVAYFNLFLLSFTCTVYLFGKPKKTAPTLFLGLVYLSFSALFFGFFLDYSLTGPWKDNVSICLPVASVLSVAFFIQYVYHFARNIYSLESKIVLGISLLLSPIPGLFDYWDSPWDDIVFGSIMGVGFLWVYLLLVRKLLFVEKDERRGLISSFKKLFFPRKKEARAYRALTFTILLGLSLVLNVVLATLHIISILAYSNILYIGFHTLLFANIYTYFNYSREPSSVTAKLVGISLTTVLAITSVLSNMQTSFHRYIYLLKRLQEVESVKNLLLFKNNENLPPLLNYIVVHPNTSDMYDGFYVLYARDDNFDPEVLRQENDNHKKIVEKLLSTELKASPGLAEAELRKSIEKKEAWRRKIWGGKYIELHATRKSVDKMARTPVFIVFFTSHKKDLYEMGYLYSEYRSELHDGLLQLFLFSPFVFVFILIVFPLFFHSNLIAPLKSLLAGVRKVNNGELNIQIEPQVRDEIGSLSGSFNGMVRSIRDSKHKLEEYANNLEEMVRKRTADLQNSLHEIQDLKTQQDGDYFLTSLLIEPLSSGFTKSENILVQSLVKQKKEFEFRKWKRDIGGDLCISCQMVFMGIPCTFYLNADAMGKSIQGAGGILVLGSVLEAIIMRTTHDEAIRSQNPALWLKKTFMELHQVFQSFDGSMLVSAVLGVVENETGVMYHINAEHPATVLYRNGTVNFLPCECMYRKLGTTGVNEEVLVETFELRPGDILVAGSDGRDDILLDMNFSGNGLEKIMNHDENLFLDRVLESVGDPAKILESIGKEGDLTDDLSILTLSYRPSKN